MTSVFRANAITINMAIVIPEDIIIARRKAITRRRRKSTQDSEGPEGADAEGD